MKRKDQKSKKDRVDYLFLLCVTVKSFEKRVEKKKEKRVEQQRSIAGFWFTFVQRYLLDSFFIYFYSHNVASTRQFHLRAG